MKNSVVNKPGLDPRMLTDPVALPYVASGPAGRMVGELWDHLCPWSLGGWSLHRGIYVLSGLCALAVSVMWLAALQGRMGAWLLIGAWSLWSTLEIGVRRVSKNYVKEGPWWAGRFRRASWMDLICYVSFKNLLIGVLLFAALKAAGVLVVTG